MGTRRRKKRHLTNNSLQLQQLAGLHIMCCSTRVWVWILTVLYVIQAILYFIGAISASVNIDEVHTDVKDRAIGVLVFFWIITVLDMIASISIIGALVSTMEMLFSVGKIVVVLRLLASHVFWIVSFIKLGEESAEGYIWAGWVISYLLYLLIVGIYLYLLHKLHTEVKEERIVGISPAM